MYHKEYASCGHYINALLLVLGLFCSAHSQATIIGYSNSGNFLTAIGGGTSTLDFEGTVAGTLIPTGSSLGGITFSYSIAGLDMMVADDFDTTSGTNVLGLDDADNFNQFFDGDEFSLSFDTPITALGLFFITGDPLFANDIELITPFGSVFNSDVEELVLADGGLAYYLGVVSDDAFSSVDIGFALDGEVNFLYNVDDITISAVPLPPALGLFAMGLASLAGWRRVRVKGDE